MNEPAPNGCTGACCAAFVLPYTLSELARGRVGSRGAGDDRLLDEHDQIAAMVVPIGPTQAAERLRRFAVDPLDVPPRRLFTCRNFDEATARCSIYDERPNMCRSYPGGDGRECCHDGECTCVGTPIDDLIADAA